MTTLLASNSIREQRELARYKSKQELADALHILRYTRGLKVPKHVKRLINWYAEVNGNSNSKYGTGAFFHSEETIAEEMECSLSTVERAIKWLKRHALLQVVPSWNYNEDKRGTAYKVFADLKTIKIVVNALINQNEEVIRKLTGTLNNELNQIVKKLTGTVTGTVTGTETKEKIDMPTDETPKNSDHIIPNIKDLHLRDINNNNMPPSHNQQKTGQNVRISSNEQNGHTENQQKTGEKEPKINLSKIHEKTWEFLNSYKNFAEYPFSNKELKSKYAYWIQMAINKTGAKITNPDHRNQLKWAIGCTLNSYDEQEKQEHELTKLMYNDVFDALEEIITVEKELALGASEQAVTSENPKKKSKQAKNSYQKNSYPKKPVRTEIVPEWFDKDTEEQRRKDEETKQKQANQQSDPNYIAEKQRQVAEMLKRLRKAI